MKIFCLTLLGFIAFHLVHGQAPVSIKESTQTFKTYAFSDPNPIPSKTLIYPYFRYDGFTDKPVDKQWKVIELENQYIKLMILPEIGGKIWSAWEKSTGLPFIYNNQVVKFRDVAMRGPWTSGGIEPNYGIIGHTPNCATPVDYRTETKSDGSVSCYVGTFDKLTQTFWTIEINLQPDRAYFTTHSTWHNGNSFEQPYYTWMNVGMPAKGNLEFIFPGTRYIGHEGEYANWNINQENIKDISFYEQNNFGGYKSYHVFGSYTDFFASFYHDTNFGMGRYSLYDEKPGKKIWIWGLSRQGMIWENLLSDTDGQYVEVQSGRLFNQSSDGSIYTPFKHRGFAPYATDEWTEYWFPIKGTKGVVKADPHGSLNLRLESGYLKWSFSPLQSINENFIVYNNGNKLVERKINVIPLQLYKDSIQWSGDLKKIVINIGNKFSYDADPTADDLSRPVQLPTDYPWDTPYALYALGKGAMQTRNYDQAEIKFSECLSKDPYFLPALTEMSFLHLRKMEFEKARNLAMKALSINTYDPAANFAYGLANVATDRATDAQDAFSISAASMEYRSASFTELAKLYVRKNELQKSMDYAQKAVAEQPKNIEAWQIISTLHRMKGEKEKARAALSKINSLNPLSHFVNAERLLWDEITPNEFTKNISQEMNDEIFLMLADWYQSIHRFQDALIMLKPAPQQAEILYWQAYLLARSQDSSHSAMLAKADQSSPALIFPYRTQAAKVMDWAVNNSTSWKPKYFLALIHWNAGNIDKATSLFQQCGSPEYAPFYAAKASLLPGEEEGNLNKAAQLDKNEWRYGKLLVNHYLNTGNVQKALITAINYQQRYPDNDGLSFLLARCYLLNKQYANSLKVLTGKTFLPNEGATEGRQLYRESLLMMAFDQMDKGKYTQALSSIEKARQWPENLGVGKPYDADIDERFENFAQAICLEKLKKKSEADKIYATLTTEKTNFRNANLLINALAWRKNGKEAEGIRLLEEWKSKSSDKSTPDWCLQLYHQNNTQNIPANTDQLRLLARLSDYLGAKN
jgi:tetratricopeptide (TPR) repeat protein